jgi:hypothetical protein
MRERLELLWDCVLIGLVLGYCVGYFVNNEVYWKLRELKHQSGTNLGPN